VRIFVRIRYTDVHQFDIQILIHGVKRSTDPEIGNFISNIQFLSDCEIKQGQATGLSVFHDSDSGEQKTENKKNSR
jgi:hypothetical protein